MSERAFQVFRELSDKGNAGLPNMVFTWATEHGVEMTVSQVNGLAELIRHTAEHRGHQGFDIGRSHDVYNSTKEQDNAE